MVFCFNLVGCSDEVTLPSKQQLSRFEDAGPAIPPVAMDRLQSARMHESPLPGEVLEITMPSILLVVTTDELNAARADAPYLIRVSETGTITLPAVGEIEVAGKTLAQIESAIINAYYPELTPTRPSVFVRLAREQEPAQPLFTVMGLVNDPGNFPYPPSVRYNVGWILRKILALQRFIVSQNPAISSARRSRLSIRRRRVLQMLLLWWSSPVTSFSWSIRREPAQRSFSTAC